MAADVVERAARALGSLARRDVPLGPLTTYRVGGPAALFATAESEADLDAVARAVGASGIDVLVVGKGSNLLVADAGFAGLALALGSAFAEVRVERAASAAAGARVRAGGAAALPVVARRTVAAGLSGFEWAVGVPGSIGGGVRMNAGGHGSDMAASLVGVRVHDLRTGEHGEVPAASLDLGYRRSSLAAHQVVTEATLALEAGAREAGERVIAEVVGWRRAHQPGGPNAGSVFTNPPGDSAGRLIDLAGCRGLRMGSAQVSPKHANFIQADPGGRADDVVQLMREVRRRVEAATGVRLHAETCLAGFGPNPLVEVEG